MPRLRIKQSPTFDVQECKNLSAQQYEERAAKLFEIKYICSHKGEMEVLKKCLYSFIGKLW